MCLVKMLAEQALDLTPREVYGAARPAEHQSAGRVFTEDVHDMVAESQSALLMS